MFIHFVHVTCNNNSLVTYTTIGHKGTLIMNKGNKKPRYTYNGKCNGCSISNSHSPCPHMCKHPPDFVPITAKPGVWILNVTP